MTSLSILAGTSVYDCHSAVEALRTLQRIILALPLPSTTCVFFAWKILALSSLTLSPHPPKSRVLLTVSLLILTLIDPSNTFWLGSLVQNDHLTTHTRDLASQIMTSSKWFSGLSFHGTVMALIPNSLAAGTRSSLFLVRPTQHSLHNCPEGHTQAQRSLYTITVQLDTWVPRGEHITYRREGVCWQGAYAAGGWDIAFNWQPVIECVKEEMHDDYVSLQERDFTGQCTFKRKIYFKENSWGNASQADKKVWGWGVWQR